MKVKYVAVSLDSKNIGFKRFEDPKDKIKVGEKLPPKFQNTLFGPAEWKAEVILSDPTTKILEAFRLFGDENFCSAGDIPDFAREIFDASLKLR